MMGAQLAAVAFGLVGLGCVVAGLVRLALSHARGTRCQPTTGEVVACQVRGRRGGAEYRPLIRYRASGRFGKGWARTWTDRACQVGEILPVWYEPGRGGVELRAPGDRDRGAIAVILCGVLLVSGALAAGAPQVP